MSVSQIPLAPQREIRVIMPFISLSEIDRRKWQSRLPVIRAIICVAFDSFQGDVNISPSSVSPEAGDNGHVTGNMY